MNIAHIEEKSFIYGPGCRYVIWTQGCSIRCKGCYNQSMWDFSPNMEISVKNLFAKISEAEGIEGITLLGGEPLDQYPETIELLRLCQNTGLSTVVFTGYEQEELIQKNMQEIFVLTDILITGRYNENLRTEHHQWIGSTNQSIHFNTNRYKDYAINNTNYMEISIAEDSSLTVLGFPKIDLLEVYKS